jgi:hypothetical protein
VGQGDGKGGPGAVVSAIRGVITKTNCAATGTKGSDDLVTDSSPRPFGGSARRRLGRGKLARQPILSPRRVPPALLSSRERRR